MQATKDQAIQIFSILAANNPNPTTELIYASVFELLIAVVLSAQATDISVNKATKELFIQANTPQAILELGYHKLENYIKSIGLYRSKAKNIIKLCELLVDKYNSQVPDNFAELISLPGVGRKTANVILNTAFKQGVIAVDTHVFRVARRLGLAKSTQVEGVERELVKVIKDEHLINAHHHLILHGRYICKARSPKCDMCLLTAYCKYFQQKLIKERNIK